MKAGFHKSVSVLFTLSVISMLVLLGPASAVQIILSEPDDAAPGQDVSFNITVEFNAPDQYLPIQYTDIIFTGPNDFEETCRVYNDGSYNGCNLDLDIILNFNTGYGQGNGFGYDSNDGSFPFFGEGYGYGYGYYGGGSEISYEIVWHTLREVNGGEYEVHAEMYALGEDQYQDNYGFSYCGTMEGMYIEWLSLNPGGADYDSNLDLYPDGKVDLSDIIIFSQNRFNETWCNDFSGDDDCSNLYGRFREFYRIQSQGNVFNEDLDLDGDLDVDIDDLILFAQNIGDEIWCADQIAFSFEAVSHTFSSSTEQFNIISPPVETSGSGGGRRRVINETNETVIIVEESINDGVQEEPSPEETFEEEIPVQAASGNLFSAITGAVTGLGDSVGLGATISYILSILLLFGFIIGGYGVARVVKKS
jgi:hypothetical protein